MSYHRGMILLSLALCLVARGDSRDQEIIKRLEFFQQMELLEAAPMLKDFGEVIDVAAEEEKSGAAESGHNDEKKESSKAEERHEKRQR